MQTALSLVVASSALGIALLYLLIMAMRRLAAPPLPITSAWIENLCTETGGLLHNSYQTNGNEHLKQLEESARLTRIALAKILVEAAEDRPDLAILLLQNQIMFSYRGFVARWRMRISRNS